MNYKVMRDFITFKIKTEDKNLLKKEADRIGLTLASFCRLATLKELKNKEDQ